MNGVANGLYGGDLPNQINTPWIDFSEQSTIVGWSTFTQKTIRYKVVGKMVFLQVQIVGTSNSTTTSISLPFISAISSQNIIFVQSAGTNQAGVLAFAPNNNTATFLLIGGTSIAATGGKAIIFNTFYEI